MSKVPPDHPCRTLLRSLVERDLKIIGQDMLEIRTLSLDCEDNADGSYRAVGTFAWGHGLRERKTTYQVAVGPAGLQSMHVEMEYPEALEKIFGRKKKRQ